MSKKINSKQKSDINVPNKISPIRVILIFSFIIILMIALLVRVGYLQLINGDYLQTLATSQKILTETISAKRGTIYDSTGQTLAISYDTDKVYIDPTSIDSEYKEFIAQKLADFLDVEYTQIISKINESKNKFLVASNVEKNAIDSLKEWKNKQDFKTGISIESSTSRSYPCKSLASTVIGFVGTDNQGLYGIEKSWDSFLSGTPGKSVSLKDASKSEIANSQQSYISAENGYDLTLTIDANIQFIVEKYLSQAVENYKCDSGITIAMDPSTGKILAMADYPNFDCNNKDLPNSRLLETWDSLTSEEKDTARFRMWAPKAVTDTYEPGSVFKVITSAIALEENIVEPNTLEFNCKGYYTVEGESRPIKCFKYPNSHGLQTLTNALENSCNPAFIQLGLKIGAKTSYKYYEAFGLFEKTGISIPGESRSIFYPLTTIRPYELAVASFGQRFTITPIQMITAISAIANDGVLVQPQIVSSITNTDTGEITTFETKEIRQVVSKETADTVASMMESVVINGTGKNVVNGIEGMQQYSIGGKTGTSEPINGSSDGYIASFMAISPVENTKIALLVILKNPGEGVNHNGGQIAAPTAGYMLSEILPYMNVEKGNKDKGTNSNLSENDLY